MVRIVFLVHFYSTQVSHILHETYDFLETVSEEIKKVPPIGKVTIIPIGFAILKIHFQTFE
jgi:hypothetical protein